MKIAICDDSKTDCLEIKNLCEANGCSDIQLFQSGKELLTCPDLDKINLIFLDIEMGDISGIDVMHQLELSCPSAFIAFCTSHDEQMNDAFGRNVIAFITKPCKKLPINNAIQKTACLSTEFVPVKINRDTILPCSDILYLEANRKYTRFIDIYTKNSSSYHSLVYWCNKLTPFGFSQISRSCAVNLKYYRGVDKKKVLLINNIQLDISRRYLSVLKENHNTYMLHRARNEYPKDILLE